LAEDSAIRGSCGDVGSPVPGARPTKAPSPWAGGGRLGSERRRGRQYRSRAGREHPANIGGRSGVVGFFRGGKAGREREKCPREHPGRRCPNVASLKDRGGAPGADLIPACSDFFFSWLARRTGSNELVRGAITTLVYKKGHPQLFRGNAGLVVALAPGTWSWTLGARRRAAGGRGLASPPVIKGTRAFELLRAAARVTLFSGRGPAEGRRLVGDGRFLRVG